MASVLFFMRVLKAFGIWGRIGVSWVFTKIHQKPPNNWLVGLKMPPVRPSLRDFSYLCRLKTKCLMISKKISDLFPLIRAYFQDKPVLKVWLFGSCSRGEESPESDLDLLVDYDTSKGIVSLFTMGGMLMDLSDLTGRRVDLVDRRGLKSFATASVEHDKVMIYERDA